MTEPSPFDDADAADMEQLYNEEQYQDPNLAYLFP